MRTVEAIVEKATDGNYSVYMDADDMPYLVTGTGKTAEDAVEDFKKGYEEMRKHHADTGKEFEDVEFDFHYDRQLQQSPTR